MDTKAFLVSTGKCAKRRVTCTPAVEAKIQMVAHNNPVTVSNFSMIITVKMINQWRSCACFTQNIKCILMKYSFLTSYSDCSNVLKR